MDELAPGWFLRQLAETREWCQARSKLDNPERCLRSFELRPDLEANESTDRAIWVYPEMIRDLIRSRQKSLSVAGRKKAPSRAILDSGRLLVSAYDYTNFNGATAVETGYFLDENDVPPWDTWIGEIQGLDGVRPAAMGGT